MKKLILLLAVLLQILNLYATAIACTSFLVQDDKRPVMGKSYDWDLGHGMVVVNPRGMKKTGMAAGVTDRPPTWTSQYGSVTFNQYGREFPVGGMNEAGLAVEILWHFSTEYPLPDARPSLNELQWIQYQLDNYASVKEMVAHADEIRIAGLYAKVHYLAVDKRNNSASFSYIDGKLVINEDVLALTNTNLSKSRSYLRKFTGFSGNLPIPKGKKGSLDRYVIARSMLASGDRPDAVSERIGFAYSILDAVKTPGYTQWQIVYDLAGREIYFRTAENQRLRLIRLAAFNFSCTEPVLGFPIDSKDDVFDHLGQFFDYCRKLFDKSSQPDDVSVKSGQCDDVSYNFSQLTDHQNAKMVARGAYPILSSIPDGVVKKFKGYPASMHCETVFFEQSISPAKNSL
jgi:penicillin V acylase-like amidase (Ntn superfamily)